MVKHATDNFRFLKSVVLEELKQQRYIEKFSVRIPWEDVVNRRAKEQLVDDKLHTDEKLLQFRWRLREPEAEPTNDFTPVRHRSGPAGLGDRPF